MMGKKSTKEIFILKSQNKHGDKYDYSKVEYVGNKNKVIIICSKHGEFSQRPKEQRYLQTLILWR